MYSMFSNPIPAKVDSSAFHNETGNSTQVDCVLVGISFDPIEFVVEVEGSRFYDVPLRFFGGGLYPNIAVGSAEWDPETPKPVYLHGVESEGLCYGALTWVEFNVTLLLVVSEGCVYLWPPHKLSFGVKASLPNWKKRRYPTTLNPMITQVEEVDVSKDLELAITAIQDSMGWRSHGIGVIQKYMGDRRVHVWHQDSVKIHLEGGIHNHRYDLTSTVVAGALKQEEWFPTLNEHGFWRRWIHNNESKVPVPTDEYFDLDPWSMVITTGHRYLYPRTGYHRTVPISEIAITVVDREEVHGVSSALIPRGMTPVNGQTVELDIPNILQRARKHLKV